MEKGRANGSPMSELALSQEDWVEIRDSLRPDSDLRPKINKIIQAILEKEKVEIVVVPF
jgi:hypothetical protein